MADTSYLAWPFFDDGHRAHAREVERWADKSLPPLLSGAEDSSDSVYACVARLVAEMGKAGLLRVCVPAAYGGLASFYVIFARSGEPGAKGLSAFVVDADAAGLDASERIEVIAPHPLATLRLAACRVPAERLLGQPGEGFKIAMATLDAFRSTVGAAALGFARRALDEATGRAHQRRLFGRTLAEFQMTQSKAGEMAMAIDAAALMIYRAAWTKDVVGGRVTREASMAKLFATEAAQQVIDAALQLFGGLGVVRGVAVERLYREIRALRIYEGASEVLKLIIGSKVLEGHSM